MSSIAQEEARSISENILWSIRKKYEAGKFSLPYSHFLGYDKGEDGNPVINPTQATTVRLIFTLFLEGKTPNAISNELIKRGYRTGTGGLGWTPVSVVRILKNEKYCGQALLQKTFKTDLLSKRRVNNGEVPKYLVRNNHEAIITLEQFEMTQLELANRKSTLKQHSAKSIFSDKIICGDCGEVFGPKLWHSTDKYRRTIWQCNSKYKTHIKCTTPHFSEAQIKTMFIEAVNQIITDKNNVIPDLEEFATQLLNTDDLEVQLSKAQAKLEIAQSAINQYFNGIPDTKKFEALQKEFTATKTKVEKLETQIIDRKNRSRKMKLFISEISELDCPITEFSDQMWLGLVDKVLVHSTDNIEVVFKSGMKIRTSVPAARAS